MGPGSVTGHTLVECLLVAGLVSVLGSVAVPALLDGRDAARTEAAARHLASRIRLARLEAARRGVNVALQVESLPSPGGYRFGLAADGDHDGVRLSDIAAATDAPIGPAESLPELFGRVEFGIAGGIASIDPAEPLTDDNPIRIGRSGLLSFGPEGGASGGTLYILGPARRQWAVRVLASTGRVRLMAFSTDRRAWIER